jgi:hypothetical protein
MLRIPHCLDNRLIDGGKVVSPATSKYSRVLHPKLVFLFLGVDCDLSPLGTPATSGRTVPALDDTLVWSSRW